MEMFSKVLAVGIGGAFGAIARFLINVSPAANIFEKFPLPTLLVNVAGSFLIGLLLILLTDKFVVSEHVRFAVIVGFLGAFTTFSTFEMELWGLIRESRYASALIYLFTSVVVGFAALLAGILLARRI